MGASVLPARWRVGAGPQHHLQPPDQMRANMTSERLVIFSRKLSLRALIAIGGVVFLGPTRSASNG